MTAGADRPLPSAPTPAGADIEEEEAEAEEAEIEAEEEREEVRRPSPPGFRISTFVYTFLFLLGLSMIFFQGTRYAVAIGFDWILSPLIGFGGSYPLLTMFLAAAFEMALTAIAYNYTTDWIKAAKVQKWSAAFRKVQMAAMRSGKRDRIAALQPHQQKLTRISSEVSFAQLKGMAITWFLVIALYTWVYLFLVPTGGANTLVHPHSTVVALGAGSFDLVKATFAGFNVLQNWFLVFTLYTVPLSLVFRRLLKHQTLRRYAANLLAPPVAPTGGAREPA